MNFKDKSPSFGKKHPLLMYRRTYDRLFGASLVFGLLLWLIGKFPILGGVSDIPESVQVIIFLSALVVLSLSGISFLARSRCYVRAFRTHLRIVTPLLSIDIPYRRILSLHPVLTQQIFSPRESSWARRTYLSPLAGKTAVVITLRGYPMKYAILRYLMPAEMFSPHKTGFVLLVKDWMKFSTELDTFHGKWLGKMNYRGRLVETAS